MSTLSPAACGPRALGVHIRQTTSACVTTVKCIYVRNYWLCHIMNEDLPLQFLPSNARVYPVLQEQIKLPTVLLQLCSHPSVSRVHSLISVMSKHVYYTVCK